MDDPCQLSLDLQKTLKAGDRGQGIAPARLQHPLARVKLTQNPFAGTLMHLLDHQSEHEVQVFDPALDTC
jgi:hypothetical protein